MQHPGLDRLIRFAVDNVADPAPIERLTGVAQERPPRVPGSIAIYNRHAARPVSNSALPENNRDARMGGGRSLPNPLEHLRTADPPN